MVSRDGAAEARTSGPDVDVQLDTVKHARKIAGTADRRIWEPVTHYKPEGQMGGTGNIKGYC